jgi:AcrR family transcriptional regulator
LYKYFPDLEAVLRAWHERQVGRHLEQLAAAREAAGGDARRQLEAVLSAYASLAGGHDGSPLAASLHGGEHVTRAQHHLRGFIADLLTEGARAGHLRADVPAAELADYVLAALSAAGGLPAGDARERLVGVVLDGLRPPG